MAEVSSPLFCFAFLLVMKFSYVIGDSCVDFTTINDPYRSTKYKLVAGEKAICDDKLTAGWYRFTSIAGETMPTTKPDPYYCGTVAPIWMKGAHPTTNGQVLQATACTNLYGRNEGCVFPVNMQVKNCGGFFVYYLQPSFGCAMAYCAGDRKPCSKGQTGIFPNCKGSVITPFSYRLVPTPKVTYKKDNNPKVTMLCQFQFLLWKNVSFHVEWFTDGHSVKNDTIDSNQTAANNGGFSSEIIPYDATSNTGHYLPGHRVRCRLRMKYNTNPDNKWTELWRDSDYYFVGIEIHPLHTVVRECRPDLVVNVTFRPTVPFLPDDNAQKKSVPIEIYVPKKFEGDSTQSALSTCEISLSGTNAVTFRIQGICDNRQESNKKMEYHFIIRKTHPFWFLYRLPSLAVTVLNTDTKQCTAWGDPHYVTFSGRGYDFYEDGDYIFYKNTERNIEIHTRLWHCWGVSCNCGIAVREGNDVFVITTCNLQLKYFPRNEGGLPTPLRIFISSNGPLARGTHIYKTQQGSRTEFQIVLPSGTRINVVREFYGMNVYLYATGGDESRTPGLCGNFNGNQNDEFQRGKDNQPTNGDPKAFARSWKINKGESYFDTLPQVEETNDDDGQSCFCKANSGNFTNCQNDSNSFQYFRPISGEEIRDRITRKKRSLEETNYNDDVIDHEERSFFLDDSDVHFALRRVRAKREAGKRMSKENATEYCKSHIENSLAGKTCKNVPGTNITVSVLSCIVDLEITGDIRLALSSFNAMKEGCEDTALKNMSLYEKDENGVLKPPAEVGNALCPGDCSEKGTCVNRTCVCNEGYTSADCSMEVNSIPELFGIYDKGMCDLRERPCKITDLLGKDFINSENLTCHVQEVKVIDSNWTVRSYPQKYPGKMIDIFGVRCNLPDPPTKLGDYDHEGTPAGGLLIAISNNGEHKSQRQMPFVSYDSVCMVCINTVNKSNCQLKNDSCLINGHCFAVNAPNPKDWCQQCKPEHNQTSWMQRTVNRPPQFMRNHSTRYAIYGEYLPLRLKATDPDNRPVKYSLISSTATGYTFSSTGLLKWNVTSQTNQQFVFKVTDECNASDTITITIRIVTCPCQNGGKCSPHPFYPRGSGQYYCTCPQGFTGDRCETNIDDCVGVNCGNGTCVDGVNNSTCRCDVGFTGSLCDQRLTRCTNQTCFPGVTCTEIPAGVSCGPCPVGFSGDGKTCVVPSSTTPSTAQSTTEQVESTMPSTAQHATTEQDPTTTREPTATSATIGSTKFVRAEIRIKKKWNEDYRNKKSQAFRTLAQLLIQEIWKSFKEAKNKYLKNVEVISLRPGSVIAEFELAFEKEQKDPLAPLKASAQDGKLGSLEVDYSSLKIKPEVDDDPSKTVLIIVLVVVGVLLILVVIAIAVVIKIKRSKSNEDRVPKRSEKIPPEAYEMPRKESKEHHLYAELRAPAVYENAGFGQDSTPNHYDEPKSIC